MKYYKIESSWGKIEETKIYYEIAKDNGFNVKNLILENYHSKFEIELNTIPLKKRASSKQTQTGKHKHAINDV